MVKVINMGKVWIDAIIHLSEGQDNDMRTLKLYELFNHPVCRMNKLSILKDKGMAKEIYSEMAIQFTKNIADLEVILKNEYSETCTQLEKYALLDNIRIKKEILSDFQNNCLK